MSLNEADKKALTRAVRLLETPGLGIRVSNLIGKPIEDGLRKLPTPVRDKITAATELALQAAMKAALATMKEGQPAAPRKRRHKFAAALSGSLGGAFGFTALAAELPISTTIMLRAIAEIARAEGEDLRQASTQMACLEVFALGGRSDQDDGAESAYFATRNGLAMLSKKAASYLAEKSIADDAAPIMLRLISSIAAKFSIPVSEKFVAQAIPVIGALGGGAINLLFIDHFQDVATGHFTVRRLEKTYGEELVRKEYRRIRVAGEPWLDDT
ncbi:MAG: EcsC family protein [Planctomycetota bacterium]